MLLIIFHGNLILIFIFLGHIHYLNSLFGRENMKMKRGALLLIVW